MDLIDMKKTFQTAAADYLFFSASNRTFSGIRQTADKKQTQHDALIL